ncbi:glycosyltransferase family 2 protein, partial [Fangia hongkongensis]
MEFSIITVCYNAITTIEKTILSVKNQSFEDYEHIIIDGGSTDGTLGVIDKYRDNFAVIISEPDNGIYDAMNKGISLSKGKFIAMLNADDFYLDNVLESVYLGIQRSGESVGVIYYGNLVVFNEKKEDGYVVKPLPLSQLANFMCLNHPTCFVSKDLYQMRYNIMYKSAADQ